MCGRVVLGLFVRCCGRGCVRFVDLEDLRFCVMCARGECFERVECVVGVLGFQDVEVVRM